CENVAGVAGGARDRAGARCATRHALAALGSFQGGRLLRLLRAGPGGTGRSRGSRVGRCGARRANRGRGGPGPSSYEVGLLALREGLLLEHAVRALEDQPDVLLVSATGRDHPRGAGLALHLGAVLGVPTVGITHRPLLAAGEWPTDERGATSPLVRDGELVGYWLRTRRGA